MEPNKNDEGAEEEEIEDEISDDDSSKTDWEARAKHLEGIAKRLKTKLAKASEKKPDLPGDKKQTNSNDMDFGKLAYLAQKGVEHPDDIAYVNEVLQNSPGSSLMDVLSKSYVTAELKERKDNRTTRDAVPSNSRRSNSTSRDKAEYWIAKGELPPESEVKLRREVVNKRMEVEKSGSKFAPQGLIR